MRRIGIADAVVTAPVLAAAMLALVTACSTSGSTAASSSGGAAASGSTPATASGDALAGMSADQIASKAVADLRTVSSVHVKGSITDSGQTVGLDLTLAGTKCEGGMSVAGTGSFQLIALGSDVWLKPSDSFWKSATSNQLVLSLVKGKWLKTTIKRGGLADLASLCDPKKLADQMFSGTPHGLSKAGTATINGQPALRLTEPGASASAYVSQSATPQFLRITAGSTGELDFTDYNTPAAITIPPASDTLDAAKYGF